jgi:hypothetical protein
MKLIGRHNEKKKLEHLLRSNEAELLAIYGRRRVGKTFLIREFFKGKGIFFEIVGQKNASFQTQLDNFYQSIYAAFSPDLPLKKPESWKEAFSTLTSFLKYHKQDSKRILFFDELPWLATKRSGLLQALDYEWNSQWSKMDNLIVIVCGSAASWILEKLINAKGGLHNRITDTIHLHPFTLSETNLYLKNKGIKLNPMQVLELYMVMGGIPHYLRQVKKGQSSTQVINTLCFHKDGFLFSEFNRLFESLFDHSDVHHTIIREIAKKRNGISREDLLKATGLSSGGTFKKRILELRESGFIEEFIPFGKRKKDFMIKISDEYTLFFLNWIEPIVHKGTIKYNPNYWLNMSNTPLFKTWSGYAFEAVCIKHINCIIKSLEISNMAGEIGTWYHRVSTKSDNTGAQIDLVIDRNDNAINICEIKYSSNIFTIDKNYAKKLMNKISVFETKTKTNKQIFLTMITTHGIKKNLWSEDLVQSEVVLAHLFDV